MIPGIGAFVGYGSRATANLQNEPNLAVRANLQNKANFLSGAPAGDGAILQNKANSRLPGLQGARDTGIASQGQENRGWI